MNAEAYFQAVEAIALVIALGFAILQVRQYRRDKHREAAMELLHSFQTPSFARALNIVYAMPGGLSKEEVEQYCGNEFHLVYAMTTTWESLGVLVHRGEIDLQLIDDFFSGPIRISWVSVSAPAGGPSTSGFSGLTSDWWIWKLWNSPFPPTLSTKIGNPKNLGGDNILLSAPDGLRRFYCESL